MSPYQLSRRVVASLVAMVCFGTLLSPTFSASGEKSALGRPKLIAAKFHADWCPLCKQMDDSIMEDLADRFDGMPVLVLTLDVTNQTARHHSEMLAAALGLDDLWAKNGGKTGTIYLVNAETKKELGLFGKDNGFSQIAAEIEKNLK